MSHIRFGVVISKSAVIPRLLRYKTTLHDPQVSSTCSDWVGSFILVRVVRLERTVSWSQTRRDTNFAIPGYSISSIIPRRAVKIKFFCLWSFMWSKPISYRFRQSGKIRQTQVLQGFAAFHNAPSRIPPRHSQTRRDTSFAIPGYARECG